MLEMKAADKIGYTLLKTELDVHNTLYKYTVGNFFNDFLIEAVQIVEYKQTYKQL